MQLYQPSITGSLSVSGSINISGSINVVGSGGTITGTASYANNAELLDGLDSTVFTLTSSFAAQTASFTAFTSSVNTFTASINSFSSSVLSYTSSLNAKTSSFATTGSNTFEGIQTINSNLVVTGSITAQTLVVQTVTSSVVYSSGSNVFGNNIANTQTFTGSMNLTGSLTVVTTGTELQVTSTGVRIGNISTDTHPITGSVNITGSLNTNNALYVSSSTVGIGTATPSYKFEVSNLGSGVTVGDFYVDTTNNSVYVGRQSSTSGDNSKFYVRNRVNTLTALSVDPGGNGAVDVVGTFSTTRGTNLATAIGNVGIGTSSPSVQFNVGNEAHGVGIAYRGSSALPSIAGLFTSDGTGGGQTGYGSLLIKARTDYGGYYSLNFFTAASDNTPVERMSIASNGIVTINNGLNISPGSTYTTTLTYTPDWAANFQTAVPTGTLSGSRVYLFTIWTNSFGTPPYYAAASGIITTSANTNSGGSGPEINLLTSHHVNSTTTWQIRMTTTTNSTAGVEVKLLNGPSVSGTAVFIRVSLLSIL